MLSRPTTTIAATSHSSQVPPCWRRPSRKGDGGGGLPASAAFAPPLLSVDKGLFADPLEFAYELRHQVEFQAHGRGYLGPFAQEPATSWAAPHLAGIAARILSLRPGLKPFEMKALLYWMFQARNGGGAGPPA